MILSGGNDMIWSSNSRVTMRSNDLVVVVQLLDTRNLVVRDKSNTGKVLIILVTHCYMNETPEEFTDWFTKVLDILEES